MAEIITADYTDYFKFSYLMTLLKMTKMGTQFKADAFLKIGFKDRKSRVQ